MSETRIYCKAVCCENQKDGQCQAETIHLQGICPDADNVFGCSEFYEKPEAKE